MEVIGGAFNCFFRFLTLGHFIIPHSFSLHPFRVPAVFIHKKLSSNRPFYQKERIPLEIRINIPVDDSSSDGIARSISSKDKTGWDSGKEACAVVTILPSLLFVSGPVAAGYGRGSRKLGVPTANLPHFNDQIEEDKRFSNGVYFGWGQVEGDDVIYGIVANIGRSPTFVGQENAVNIIEAHILGKESSDFYGKILKLGLVAYLRPEIRFPGFEALLAQIKLDILISTKMTLLAKKFSKCSNSQDNESIDDHEHTSFEEEIESAHVLAALFNISSNFLGNIVNETDISNHEYVLDSSHDCEENKDKFKILWCVKDNYLLHSSSS